jgi:GT2 family glycosyltransferase
MDSQPQPPAPAVVAVVVTCDPGRWFEQVLASLAEQDYPNLSVLVIDAASSQDPTARVAAVLPRAYVSRLGTRVGFGRAANEVLKLVEGASHILFCHDDVALAPDAVRALVEEAYRSNAGIATPKYVQWDQPDHLLAVGATADKVGVVQNLVEPGELDQEQHDVVREVFVAPSGATLVRADLFRALGGFNATIDQFGEDLDLSWRARVAGARVIAVPAARVRHLQARRQGLRAGWADPAARKQADRRADGNRVRTVVTCYRWYVLAWIFPLAVVYMLGESVTRLLQGRPGDAVHTVGSFATAFRRPRRLCRGAGSSAGARFPMVSCAGCRSRATLGCVRSFAPGSTTSGKGCLRPRSRVRRAWRPRVPPGWPSGGSTMATEPVIPGSPVPAGVGASQVPPEGAWLLPVPPVLPAAPGSS